MITTLAQQLVRKSGGSLNQDTALLGDIIDGAARMRGLLANLLAYTTLATAPNEPAVPVDLNAVVQVVKQNLAPLIEDTSAVVTCETLPVLSGHACHFISLFQNLVANAIRYRSEQPPRIHISVRREPSELWFSVSDNGVGVPMQYQAEIFEPFKRLHGGNIPGTGLGLAICRRVVEQHGGRIWVESKPGEGSIFFFSLPDAVVVELL